MPPESTTTSPPAAGAASALPPPEVDPKFAKAIDAASPVPLRMMAARGMVPGAGPKDLLAIQYALTFDTDAGVAAAAQKAFAEAPTQIIKGSVAEKTHPGVIDLLARGKLQNEEILEFLVLKKQIHDETLMFLAESCPVLNIVEIIGKNQERLLQNPRILDALKKNPVTPKSLVDVTVAFLQMAGVLPTGAAAKSQGLPEKLDPKMIEQVAADEKFEDELVHESGETANEQQRQTLLQKIQGMSIPKRVKLAYLGNKESRGILIRETNRVVVTAVLNSGKVQEAEAEQYSKNRVISSDVLRWIAGKGDFVKNYAIRRNLAFNPKTPQDVAMKQIPFMRMNDLKELARDSGIPVAIKTQAKNLSDQKTAHRS